MFASCAHGVDRVHGRGFGGVAVGGGGDSLGRADKAGYGVELGTLSQPSRGLPQLCRGFRVVGFVRQLTANLELVRTRGIRLSN